MNEQDHPYQLRRFPSCKEANRLLSLQSDMRFSFRTRVLLRLHVFVCAACTQYEKQLRILRSVFRQLRAEEASTYDSVALSPSAAERMKHAMGQVGN